MTETTYYAPFGISTVRGAYWLMTVELVLGVNLAAFYAARTHDYWTVGLMLIWVFGMAYQTTRALRRLVKLPPDDPAAQLAFELACLLPAVGITPFLFFMGH